MEDDLNKAQSLSEFEREYFVQTRQEIDTEKGQRDRFVHYAMLLLGALAFGAIQSPEARDFLLLDPINAALLAVTVLVMLTAMAYVRWKKLSQIADRWYVLREMLQDALPPEKAERSLEQSVVEGFVSRRYVRKDICLHVALSFPAYVLLLVSAMSMGSPWAWLWCPLAAALIAISVGVAVGVLGQPLRAPAGLVERMKQWRLDPGRTPWWCRRLGRRRARPDGDEDASAHH